VQVLTFDETIAAVRKMASSQLRSQGFRWATSLTWTGDDGQSNGTLRLSQFGTVKGARAHHLQLLQVERGRATAEETSIVESPGAALFTDESRADGEIVTATFGRGVVVGHIAVTDAGRHVRNDVLTLVLSISEQLPDDPWKWTDPAVTPLDLNPLLLTAPSGSRNVTTPEEFGVSVLSEGFVDPDDGESFLRDVRFKRAISTDWTGSNNVTVSVRVLLFEDRFGATYYTENTQEHMGVNFPSAVPGEIVPGIPAAKAYFYTYEGLRVGASTFFRGNLAVEVYVWSSREIDKANLFALSKQQFDRLPDLVA
jgi:hypothetical protein